MLTVRFNLGTQFRRATVFGGCSRIANPDRKVKPTRCARTVSAFDRIAPGAEHPAAPTLKILRHDADNDMHGGTNATWHGGFIFFDSPGTGSDGSAPVVRAFCSHHLWAAGEVSLPLSPPHRRRPFQEQYDV